MQYTKVSHGVVALHDGKYWGILYEDGQVTSEGFGSIESARVSDQKYCKIPTDMTWNGSPYKPELARAKLVPVTITTVWEVGE